MKIATSFNVFLVLSLSFLVAGNIVGLVYFAPRYFSDYVEDVRQTFPNDEYTLINTFIASKDFDAATIEEYRLTLEDLRNLSKSLESYIPEKAPVPDTFESLQRIGFAGDTIREVLFLNSVQSFLSNITSIAFSNEETPEKRFLLRLLSTVVYMNAAYIALIVFVTVLWSRVAFGSIRSLTERIHSLVANRDYSALSYRRKDEFAPLVDAMNVLSANLSRQEKIRSDFISDFSHEIKTPIAALKILFESVEDGIVELDANTLAIVKSEIGRLLSTTNAILEYEKVAGTESSSLKRERFDLIRLARQTVAEYEPLFSQSFQTANVEREGVFEVFLDREGIARVFHNALSNFAKYAGKGAALSVRMHRRDGKVVIVFSDDGAGIARDQIPYLREKFYQADSARSGDVKRGIGIGLSIVDKIARLHDGNMAVSGDRGRWFQLRLTLSEKPSPIIHVQDLPADAKSV